MNWIRSLFSRWFRPQWCIVVYVGMYERIKICDYFYSKSSAASIAESCNHDYFTGRQKIVYEVMERERAERLEMQKAMEDCG